MKTKNCDLCDNIFIRTYEHKAAWERKKFCSILCRNRVTASKRYKNGFWVDKDGYAIKDVLVNGVKKHIRLHRLIMENHLGRKLNRVEEIHHRNGNRLDNNIENLELMNDHSKHASQYHAEASRKNW